MGNKYGHLPIQTTILVLLGHHCYYSWVLATQLVFIVFAASPGLDTVAAIACELNTGITIPWLKIQDIGWV